ncbi:NADP-dependent isocitrate dehydrogenase [Candidatus Methylacidiphilum infernorum]|uniref:Isocitrate dehydrogenase [NADP] n=1 Tax=Methylacidiphilum infernorum (isolate V4) TaxID=481448 RepID=A9QPI0_METI4|nr:NADP-dependent isocitrate dehydrogenase [Candidatus Methylacidiphilum infernorum]ABX56638.1 isocitrate dehydrogenase [Methylacidiphilum infernorum V4]ACD82994.1 Isocitrate/isopropylmalate dehydrogenase [Methylacidiphilum infernorum V4]
MKKVPITVAYGDGIGPEIMDATLKVILEAGAELEIEKIEIGFKVYSMGNPSGIEPSSWESLKRTKVFLKAPITTPQGGGFKSLNVTVRKALGLYANIRPCISYAPFIHTKHPGIDLVIIRENEEDLYGGIEHRQGVDSFQALKIMTRQGTERIIRYAFEYARCYGRKKVSSFTKDNILKITDGMFHKVFEEVAKEYPQIEKEHWIIDIGSAKLADNPQSFDVLVLANLYGDILSDVAVQIAGSVGLGASANIGHEYSMFEAIHGSAPRRAGQNVANPSGLLLAAVQMLIHIGQNAVADRVYNAWLKTIEEGIHTYDIFREGVSKVKVGTREFARHVIKNLGKMPEILKPFCSSRFQDKPRTDFHIVLPQEQKELVGVDVFIDFQDSPQELARRLQGCEHRFKLEMIANRGMAVWPFSHGESLLAGPFQCRFVCTEREKDIKVNHGDIVRLLDVIQQRGLEFTKTELLYSFNGVEGYSKGQGE